MYLFFSEKTKFYDKKLQILNIFLPIILYKTLFDPLNTFQFFFDLVLFLFFIL